MEDKITLTYRALIFGGGFWQKLVHSPCNDDRHSYYLHKLNKKIESAQKKTGPIFKKFIEELAAKYGQKDPAGKPIMSGNGLPQADPEQRDAYDDMLDEFMLKTVEVDFKKLPLEMFAHIGKTPMDWEPLEQVAQVSPAQLDEEDRVRKSARAQLHNITGGQSASMQ